MRLKRCLWCVVAFSLLQAGRSRLDGFHHQFFAIGAGLQAHHGRFAGHIGWQGHIAGAVNAGNGNQFGLQAHGKNAGVAVATGTGNGFAAQRCVHMNVAIGNHLGPRVDHGHHHQIAATRVHLLA